MYTGVVCIDYLLLIFLFVKTVLFALVRTRAEVVRTRAD